MIRLLYPRAVLPVKQANIFSQRYKHVTPLPDAALSGGYACRIRRNTITSSVGLSNSANPPRRPFPPCGQPACRWHILPPERNGPTGQASSMRPGIRRRNSGAFKAILFAPVIRILNFRRKSCVYAFPYSRPRVARSRSFSAAVSGIQNGFRNRNHNLLPPCCNL